ncbi:ShlB/FhaC/HecB family hemolysin secretion/activation protein [Methyloversatilis thermotolerans]|uniref:ShlB/FhaC/HecB family hemolysin secretion/activation protein n=1 Tax=Methyloversatilis thermotolerans TaxID=1346290 RepID=UPI000374FDFF|nr:ShlB/FhaC/HecB family hemolysin secretion/activation protein [Methyloversatilis thermotolerans]
MSASYKKSLLAVALCASFAQALFAADAVPAAAGSAPVDQVTIRRIEVHGGSGLPDADIRALSGRYENRPVSMDDLRSFVQELDALLRSRGIDASVSVPPQDDVSERLVVQVTQSRIGGVSGPEGLKSRLTSVAGGKAVDGADIARNSRQIQEDTGYMPRIRLVPGQEGFAAEASSDAGTPYSFGISFDNTGDKRTGRPRATVSAGHNDLWGRQHKLDAFYQTALENLDDVRIYGFNYRIPFYASGNSLDFSYNHSKSSQGTINGVLNIAGSGDTYGATFTHRWLTHPEALRHDSYASFTIRKVGNDVTLVGSNESLLPDLRTNTLTVGHRIDGEAGNNQFGADLSLTHNLPFGSDSDRDSFERSRTGSDRHYDIVRASGRFTRSFEHGGAVRLLARAQYTRDALPSHEQFGIGGLSSVRGFNERQVSDDKGLLLSLEYYFAGLTLNNVQVTPLLFVDSGWTWRNEALAGEDRHKQLSSLGAGARWQLSRNASVSTDLGYTLNAPDQSARYEGTLFLHASLGIAF